MSDIFSNFLSQLFVLVNTFLGDPSSVDSSVSVNKCQSARVGSNGESNSSNNTNITWDNKKFIVKVCKDELGKSNQQEDSETITIHMITDETYHLSEQTSEEEKQEKSTSEYKGAIGIYTTSNVNANHVNILGPQNSNRNQRNSQNGNNESDEDIYIGILTENNGFVVADRLVLKDLTTGILVSKNSSVSADNTLISNNKIAVKADGSNAIVELVDTEITVPKEGKGLSTTKNGIIKMRGVNKLNAGISFNQGYAVYMDTGKVSLEKVNIIGKGIEEYNPSEVNGKFFDYMSRAAVYMSPQSTFEMKEGKIHLENANGFVFAFKKNTGSTHVEEPAFIDSESSENIDKVNIKLENVDVKIDGERYFGMYAVFDTGSEDSSKSTSKPVTITLKKTNFIVPNSTAIYNYDVDEEQTFNLLDTKLSGGVLFRVASGVTNIKANNSQLEGASILDSEEAIVHLKLENNSTWTLKKVNDRISQIHAIIESDRNFSAVSTVTLKNSKIIFEKPSDNVYQTLSIGTGDSLVYTAEGNAELYLNSYLDQSNSDTDRLLIDGDVSGVTVVSVSATAGDLGDKTGTGNTQGVSLIQVSGTAQENSFKLKGDYITADNLPYQYVLSAYGPSSELGQADLGQKLVGQNGEKGKQSGNDFWDYRLQIVPTVVPQLPSYLLLPHALFHTGLVDVSNQRELLEIMQSASHEADKKRKTNFFIRGYGSNHRYTSNLSVFEYGYGADLDYNNATAGIVLNTLESKHSASSFGFMGGYGQLSLHPRAVKHSQKSVFDKWSGKLYANLDHDTGFYANGFISYDFFKGDVVTLSRGKTAELKGRLLNASLTGGQSIITGYHDFILEPQLQVIYQSLLFDQARDIDRFDIDLGSHDQLVGRIGGRLIKAFASSENADVVSFYTKLHVAHSYEKKRIVHFKDAFQLGAFGSTVETGTGVHAQLSNRIALHGDLLYQHKLTKAGFSGISVSGGLRYQF
ncbi:autotransporter outer membrane beta-barrel domain-containing protein [Bartonella sp. 1-1C]|uniref:autotransporter outer membrane beta-barrel domain-containing protein n=1 Tax=Bartonella sp. 1-1C TaxID=515256 RepID=UPI000C05BD6A|nr:autotransporter outer membrane beta-barrel domain-containing protein [Bartonella sp. 1-1C]ATO57083.1 outer membrane autotransporter barrel domain-containing protein [Bartonella sp. 1-1C]